MGHHKKHKKHSSSTYSVMPDYHTKKQDKKHHNKLEHKHHHKCNCEMKYYFPLPNIPSQQSSEKVGVLNWLAPGSVQSCCSICSSVRPVYVNQCDSCSYDRKTYPINNTAYFTTNEFF